MKILATCLLLIGLPAAAAEVSAPAELKAGLLARMDGHDEAALKHFRQGAKAAPDSDAAGSCRIYAEWLTTDKAKEPGTAKGLEEYRAGVKAYRAGEFKSADDAWHRCLSAEAEMSQVKRDCLAMLDLIPKVKEPASPAREALMLGMLAYSSGKTDAARAEWQKCLKLAGRDGATRADCLRMLDKLHSDGEKR